jgi:hypothetical protein
MLKHMALSEPFLKENRMIRKQTTFLDLDFYLKIRADTFTRDWALDVCDRLISASRDISWRKEPNPAKDQTACRYGFEAPGFGWHRIDEVDRQRFISACKGAYRTETIVKAGRGYESWAWVINPEDHIVRMSFFKKRSRNPFLTLNLHFDQHGAITSAKFEPVEAENAQRGA